MATLARALAVAAQINCVGAETALSHRIRECPVTAGMLTEAVHDRKGHFRPWVWPSAVRDAGTRARGEYAVRCEGGVSGQDDRSRAAS